MKIDEKIDNYLKEIGASKVIRKDFPQVSDYVDVGNVTIPIPGAHQGSFTFNIMSVSAFPDAENTDWMDLIISCNNWKKVTRMTAEDFSKFANDLVSGIKRMAKSVSKAKSKQQKELEKRNET